MIDIPLKVANAKTDPKVFSAHTKRSYPPTAAFMSHCSI